VDWTANLFDAIFDADLARVKDSILNGADILAIVDERDVLSAAIVADNTDKQIIRLLIESGANPNDCFVLGSIEQGFRIGRNFGRSRGER